MRASEVRGLAHVTSIQIVRAVKKTEVCGLGVNKFLKTEDVICEGNLRTPN